MSVLPTSAQAQFPFDPRALLNRLTAPLRHALPRPPVRHRSASRPPAQETTASRAPTEQEIIGLGIVGPRSWPSAYEDVIGYTFWPNEYEAEFRQRGFGDVVAAILAPPERGPASADAARRPVTTGSAVASADPECDETRVRTDWPKADIERTVELNDTQRSALDQLQTAINNAAKSVRSGACQPSDAATPADRLETAVRQLWAVQNAGIVIRGAAKNFYDTLTDEQKAKFRLVPDRARADGKPGDNPMNRQGCAQQADVHERLMRQIQQTVRPTPQQRASVEMLGRTAGGMNQYLMAACARPTQEDPLARLDSATSRLTAINYAATSMEVALSQFSAALTDEQRKRFDAMGR
ncbi:Spy/CpxP family protein refolding chaperone [Microbacteriaceae bacterium K1510]|nr:Spy/CpxP family protein refolding chaperone [Microbacteriaceae bacterium K1510]